jgi:orotate phosphoribosyltransferase
MPSARPGKPNSGLSDRPDSGKTAEDLLREAGAMLEGHFQLSSGRHAGLYVEKFRLLERPPQTEALCNMIAEWSPAVSPELVAGPTTGGILISYEVARRLGTLNIFAESDENGGRSFGRGFTIAPGQRVLVVDDVLTTGGSITDVLDAVRKLGGEPVGVGVLIDRSGGKVDFGVPLFACLKLDLPTYPADDCPLCDQGLPLTIT